MRSYLQSRAARACTCSACNVLPRVPSRSASLYAVCWHTPTQHSSVTEYHIWRRTLLCLFCLRCNGLRALALPRGDPKCYCCCNKIARQNRKPVNQLCTQTLTSMVPGGCRRKCGIASSVKCLSWRGTTQSVFRHETSNVSENLRDDHETGS